MDNYSKFFKYYDRLMGDRSGTSDLLTKLIDKYNPGSETLLELACGTGEILLNLSKKFSVYGLDVSRQMLSAARKKLPDVKFYRGDMTSFMLNRKFDVIISVFDSINHLLNFSSWKKVFNSAYKHLNRGGLLIFDMNTAVKFSNLFVMTPQTAKLGKDYIMMRVISDGKSKACWNIRMFEQRSGNNYRLKEENIRETTFPPQRVKSALKHFRKVIIIDANKKRPSQGSERLVFICKK